MRKSNDPLVGLWAEPSFGGSPSVYARRWLQWAEWNSPKPPRIIKQRKNETRNAFHKRYLKTRRWKYVRIVYMHAVGESCPCGTEWDNLHHRSYERLGQERLEDLIGLCRLHHVNVHKADAWAKRTNVSMERQTNLELQWIAFDKKWHEENGE